MDSVVDPSLVPEADLMLSGVDVHIHLAGGDVDEQDHHRIAPPLHEVPVTLEDGVLDHFIADKAGVYIGIKMGRV